VEGGERGLAMDTPKKVMVAKIEGAGLLGAGVKYNEGGP
jgi:hypothetical protein